MAEQLISFSWEVYEGGNRVITGVRSAASAGTEEALIENVALPASYRIHHPLADQPGLFRMFADLDVAASAMLPFANRFGLLGIGVPYHVFHEDEPFDQGGRAEPLAAWREEITSMRALVQGWDLLRKTRTREERMWGLALSLGGPDGGALDALSLPAAIGVARDGGLFDRQVAERDRIWEAFDDNQPRPAAWYHLQEAVNRRLQELTGVALETMPGGDGLRLTIAPRTLLGALWVQFAQAISGNLQHRACEAEPCGQWFEVSTRAEGYRKNRRYCSDGCRMWAHRRRQTRARELATAGRSVEEIGAELNSSKRAVKNWLNRRDARNEGS